MASFNAAALKGWLRPFSSSADPKRLDHRCQVVLCEVPPAISRQPDSVVYYEDNQWRYPVKDRLHTPTMFEDFAALNEIQAAEKSFKERSYREFLVSTPKPTEWPYQAAIKQTNANHPIEDRGVLACLNFSKSFHGQDRPSGKWMMAAVIDGHSGWQTSEYVSKVLPGYVEQKLQNIRGRLTVKTLSETLTAAFTEIDEKLRKMIDPAVTLGHSLVAKPGATTVCVLLNGSHIVVANIGDSRAVLCRKGKPVGLTSCHNAGDPEEAERLRAAHPGESDIIKEKQGSLNISSVSPNSEDHGNQQRLIYDSPDNFILRCLTYLRVHDFSTPRMPGSACYTKGRLQLTRSFGDFYLKDSRYANDWTNSKLMVGLPHSFPYVTAVPEITVLEHDAADDEFIILASDGLWDELTPEDACGIVKKVLVDKKASCAEAASALQKAAIERVAYKHKMSVEQVKALNPKQRRNILDDITCIVIDLKDGVNCCYEPKAE